MTNYKKLQLEMDRRQLLRGMGAASLATMFPVGSQVAQAQTNVKNCTVFFYTDGGHSGIFTSADSFAGNDLYGLRAGDVTRLGNSNLVIDSDWLGKITAGPNQALVQSCMATAGAVHGQSPHAAARPAVLQNGNQAFVQQVADSMDGLSTIQFAQVGEEGVRQNVMTENSQAQQINDIAAIEDALGGQIAEDNVEPVKRAHLAAGVAAAKSMSRRHFFRSPNSLEGLGVAYDKGVESFNQVITSNVTPQEIRAAYGLNNTRVTDSASSRMAAAELLARTGTSVIGVSYRGYDNHNDNGQREVRRLWDRNNAAVATFLNRMLPDPTINLTFVIMGDFSRNQRSGHGGGLSMNIFSNKVKNASTGVLTPEGSLPNGASMGEFYDFMKFLGGGGGANYNGPHRSLLK